MRFFNAGDSAAVATRPTSVRPDRRSSDEAAESESAAKPQDRASEAVPGFAAVIVDDEDVVRR
jgi:hypothetical protein